MAKARRPRIDPMARLSEDGFLGYVEESETTAEESAQAMIQEVPVDDVLDSLFQTREEAIRQEDQAAFEQLVHSILTTDGLLHPLLVILHPQIQGKYMLAAGGHGRRDAAKAAGKTTIPVKIVDYDEERMGIATALENLARRDLSPVEEGLLYKKLLKQGNWTQEELAAKLGMKSRGRIKDCLALVEYAPDILEMVRKRKNGGMRAAGYLHRLDDPEYGLSSEQAQQIRASIITQFLDNTLSTDGVRVAIDTTLERLTRQTQPEEIQEEHHGEALPVLREPKTESDTLPVSLEKPSPERPPTFVDRGEDQMTQSESQAQETLKRFQRFKRLVGDRPVNERERISLATLLQEIQDILHRT